MNELYKLYWNELYELAGYPTRTDLLLISRSPTGRDWLS